eukprot:1139626-Pelagomonas_calceolata.AAC.2
MREWNASPAKSPSAWQGGLTEDRVPKGSSSMIILKIQGGLCSSKPYSFSVDLQKHQGTALQGALPPKAKHIVLTKMHPSAVVTHTHAASSEEHTPARSGSVHKQTSIPRDWTMHCFKQLKTHAPLSCNAIAQIVDSSAHLHSHAAIQAQGSTL